MGAQGDPGRTVTVCDPSDRALQAASAELLEEIAALCRSLAGESPPPPSLRGATCPHASAIDLRHVAWAGPRAVASDAALSFLPAWLRCSCCGGVGRGPLSGPQTTRPVAALRPTASRQALPGCGPVVMEASGGGASHATACLPADGLPPTRRDKEAPCPDQPPFGGPPTPLHEVLSPTGSPAV